MPVQCLQQDPNSHGTEQGLSLETMRQWFHSLLGLALADIQLLCTFPLPFPFSFPRRDSHSLRVRQEKMPLAEALPFAPRKPLWVCMQENTAELQQFIPFQFPTYRFDDLNEVCSRDLPPVHTSPLERIRHRQLLLAQEVMQPDKSRGVRCTNKGRVTSLPGLAARWR